MTRITSTVLTREHVSQVIEEMKKYKLVAPDVELISYKNERGMSVAVTLATPIRGDDGSDRLRIQHAGEGELWSAKPSEWKVIAARLFDYDPLASIGKWHNRSLFNDATGYAFCRPVPQPDPAPWVRKTDRMKRSSGKAADVANRWDWSPRLADGSPADLDYNTWAGLMYLGRVAAAKAAEEALIRHTEQARIESEQTFAEGAAAAHEAQEARRVANMTQLLTSAAKESAVTASMAERAERGDGTWDEPRI